MAEKGWEEEEYACYSDEENPEEVDVSVAAKGIGACGIMELSGSLWDRAVPQDLLPQYKHWLRKSGRVGESSVVGLPETLRSLVAEGCLVQGGGGGFVAFGKA